MSDNPQEPTARQTVQPQEGKDTKVRYTGAWEWDDKVPEYLLTVCGDESVIDFATQHGDDLTEGAEVLIVKVETPIGRTPPFRAGEKVRLVKVDERHYEIIREDA